MNNSSHISSQEFISQKELPLGHAFLNIKHLQELVSDITYKKINDWDENNLILNFRKTKNTGWRFFSIMDAVRIKIISELRRFGVRKNLIKKILKNLSAIDLTDKKITLLIDANGVISLCSKNQDTLLNTRAAILILPIHIYFNEITKKIENNKERFLTSKTLSYMEINKKV